MTEAELKLETDAILRPATRDDAPAIAEMVQALAEYQDQGAYMTATIEDFQRNGFGPDRQFVCILAESEGSPVGLAIYFPTYSTWDGKRGLYIQDLFVAESVRGHGVGIRLVREVAQIAKQRDCSHLQLNVDCRLACLYHMDHILRMLHYPLDYNQHEFFHLFYHRMGNLRDGVHHRLHLLLLQIHFYW